jgi:hypothetical protein
MSWSRREVAVTFIDDATGKVFAATKLPPDDLPESFEIETIMHLGEANWSVVHAEPKTRAQCAGSGFLTLRLRRLEMVDPSKILYTLPTICDRIPAIGHGALVGDECVLHEDDWRQFELVSRQLAAESEEEIEAIRRIHSQERVDEIGFRKIHVRSRPDPPIIAQLTRIDLESAFGDELTYRGVRYRDAISPVASGYSFRAADGLECYGVEEDGRVTVLGIVQHMPELPPFRSADALAQIALQFDLELVNWCRCARALWDMPLFRHLLLGDDIEEGTGEY